MLTALAATDRGGPAGLGVDVSALEVSVGAEPESPLDDVFVDQATKNTRARPKKREDKEQRKGQPRNIYCHLCGQPTDIRVCRVTLRLRSHPDGDRNRSAVDFVIVARAARQGQ